MRKLVYKGSISFLLCLLLFVTNAQAHYMWLNVDDYTLTPNRNARFTVGWGHKFYSPVGAILSDQTMVSDIHIIDPTGKKLKVNAVNSFQYSSADRLPAGNYLALVSRKEGFSTKTPNGHLHQPKKGVKDVISSRYLGMYGKAIINVGEKADTKTIMSPVGLPLEIVPLSNPADLRAGDTFKFRLLYKDQPLAEYVNATYAGFSTQDAWAYSMRTDRKGLGAIKLLSSGVWVIKVNHKEPYPDPEMADNYSYTMSITFEVP